MDAMFFISIFGTIASIVGALISISESRKSRDAAEEAKRVKAQLIDHRKTSDLAQVQSFCKKAQRSMEKYGPGSVPSSLIGVSPRNDAENVQEFLMSLREHRHYFGSKSPNEADDFSETVTPLLESFAQSAESTDLKNHGKQILIYLADMSSILKRLLDSKKETYR